MAIGAAAAIVGAGSSIVGGFLGNQSSQYQSQVAKMNEKIAKQNADNALVTSQIDQQESDMQTSSLLGEQEAAQSASGLSLTGKSAIHTRASARLLGRRDALNIIHAGRIESRNYRIQAANFKSEANASKISGRNAIIGGFLGAASSLVGAPSGSWDSLISKAPATSKAIAKPIPKPVGLVY